MNFANIENLENDIKELFEQTGRVVIDDVDEKSITKVPILPIAPRPIFPGISVPLFFTGKDADKIGRHFTKNKDGYLGIVLAKTVSETSVFDSKVYDIGVLMKIIKHKRTKEGVQVLARALHRIEKVKVLKTKPVLTWEIRHHKDKKVKATEEIKAYMTSMMTLLKELLTLNPLFQEQLKLMLSTSNFKNPGLTMDSIAALTMADGEELQFVLESFDLIERGGKVLTILRKELERSRVEQDIRKQLDAKLGDHQREFFLREQLKIIKKELGLGKNDNEADVEKFTKRIENLKLTEEATKGINEELSKLGILDPASPEYHVTRAWLDWATILPWGIYSEDRLDVSATKSILDKDHYGLENVKERILEFIAMANKKGELSGSIICLVGPPGVGKTSVGKSIARAIGRKFYRFSLGGMRDEAEIKGHRRTYIGAMPGKFIQAMKRCETQNPVIMLDEIDKLSNSYSGDPASALLEVLDPEQNVEFHDHYLDLPFDLSKALFVTTANSLDTIPAPLRDRMEIISLSGYILEEKVKIAQKYIIPQQLKKHGLKRAEFKLSVASLKYLIEHYAREAGVRHLEQNLRKLMRRITLVQLEKTKKQPELDLKFIEKALGKPYFVGEELYDKDKVGVALGLAWTSMGGATLYIEAISHKSQKADLKLTGQLGDVMKESAQLAYTFVRSNLDDTNGPEKDYFNNRRVHLHVPEGATPKDGPSAGMTMALALYSLATGIPIKNSIAMTGELTITGKVLPIGGVREKIIAARRVGIKQIILPALNRRDFTDLPDYIQKGIKVFYAKEFKDILKVALAKGKK